MSTYHLSIIWLIGLLPSFAFGFGGTVLWTLIMIFVDEYQDTVNPNRNGVRNSRKSKEGNKTHTVAELNYFDKNPEKYKAFWNGKYQMLDVTGNEHHYEYYRCKECGHVIMILVWKEDKRVYGSEIVHWCRGCQGYSNLTKISYKTYFYENKYYEKILAIMKFTKNGNIEDIYDMLQKHVDGYESFYVGWQWKKNKNYKYSSLKKYYIDGEVHYDVTPLTSTIRYNASDIEPWDRYGNGLEEVEKMYDSEIRDIFIACMKLKKYPFYSRIFVPAEISVTDYLKMKGQDLFLRFVDEEGHYLCKDGYRVEDPKSIYLLQQIDAGVYDAEKYKGGK